MKKFAFAGLVAAVAIAAAGSASAAVVTGFTPDGASPAGGYTVIDNFNTAAGLYNATGAGYLLTTAHDGNGAPPANSTPYDTSYLSVLGGGAVSINFGALTSKPVNAFEFDWGSIDSYNTLIIHSSIGDVTIIPGSLSFPNAANGDQIAAGTNGLFRVTGNAGETFSGLTLRSGSNSFEIDNLAVAGVPEPAAWAMMIMGMGSLGVAMRNRRKAALASI
ncbi:MAG: PEPxxWA-CTERM sorting domain-containing protein [Caulobacteraceae bacterium]